MFYLIHSQLWSWNSIQYIQIPLIFTVTVQSQNMNHDSWLVPELIPLFVWSARENQYICTLSLSHITGFWCREPPKRLFVYVTIFFSNVSVFHKGALLSNVFFLKEHLFYLQRCTQNLNQIIHLRSRSFFYPKTDTNYVLGFTREAKVYFSERHFSGLTALFFLEQC